MPNLTILGSGSHVPGEPVPNEHLARVMDTSSEWIHKRTGIEARHYAADGTGASDLALPACKAALEAAGLEAGDVDYILFNTMTPDYLLPGSGTLLGAKLGIPGVPALDLRQQCAAVPFSLQLADGLLATGAAKTILLVGADVHSGFMPWKDWDALAGNGTADPDDYRLATDHRGVSVLFGDGAGALVLGDRGVSGTGLLASKVASDGRHHDAFRIAAGGFRRHPYLGSEMLENGEQFPAMKGKELFRAAVQNLPEVVRAVCDSAHVGLGDVDWFVAHQANDRINQTVKESLGLPDEKVPSNIARYGNTSSATIPILLDELLRSGRMHAGQLVCLFALGAGLNWGAALMRL
ncbi:MAG TPA: 3-oxoacyl-[acyl-carrier-protein] synthase III C-terminal domain-containing protein [Polyangiaceae bacterium]|jgi:3-oxoacyl-[acyl-carrier-protein] synthase-3|nr:3-oxoacyl-[acyl-carrier-protein] synthase III C-terminal domain-containing protein [Polyangiaceae bacterium]